MNVLLVQLDGSLPNCALMKIAAHHRAHGDLVAFKSAPNRGSLKQAAWLEDVLPAGEKPDVVYGSLIFDRTKPLAERLRRSFDGTDTRVHLGGTGWDLKVKLVDVCELERFRLENARLRSNTSRKRRV